jgi:hypothetical protein
MRTTVTKRFLPLLLLPFLSACAATGGAFSCPVTGFMADSNAIAYFARPVKKPGPQDVGVYAEMKNLKGHCALALKKDSARVDLSFDAVVHVKDAPETLAQQNLSYFVAVLDAQDNILQRAQFYITVPFEKDPNSPYPGAAGFVTEEHKVTIPLKVPSDAAERQVVIGFTLTPEQLAFNRARAR